MRGCRSSPRSRVALEAQEELRQRHLLADTTADARCVVEHDPQGHAAYVVENILETLGDALGGLAAECLHVSCIARRKAQFEVLDRDELAFRA